MMARGVSTHDCVWTKVCNLDKLLNLSVRTTAPHIEGDEHVAWRIGHGLHRYTVNV